MNGKWKWFKNDISGVQTKILKSGYSVTDSF